MFVVYSLSDYPGAVHHFGGIRMPDGTVLWPFLVVNGGTVRVVYAEDWSRDGDLPVVNGLHPQN